jgi:hypothetical protein
MREAGFEPTTSASGGQRSIQLSYSRRSTAEKRKRKIRGRGRFLIGEEQKATRLPIAKQAFWA